MTETFQRRITHHPSAKYKRQMEASLEYAGRGFNFTQ
jgi:hypothetical protein